MSRREWAWVVVVVSLGLILLASRLLPYDVYLALVGVLIGAVISGAISYYIYERSSEELRIEAEELRKLHNATLNALPIITDGKIKVIRDERGYFKKAENTRSPTDSIAVEDSVQTKNTS
jgi:hypothetical protein